MPEALAYEAGLPITYMILNMEPETDTYSNDTYSNPSNLLINTCVS